MDRCRAALSPRGPRRHGGGAVAALGTGDALEPRRCRIETLAGGAGGTEWPARRERNRAVAGGRAITPGWGLMPFKYRGLSQTGALRLPDSPAVPAVAMPVIRASARGG
ncbi:hypothetical protein LNKW23_07080 [Paralimibaculum aggregatum]|uniref:Uncharacterized protein n=1 Tax=Paralimibaculum aggregatum TaxID=3036245 RepID=A0ABQ6LDR0_9RHOB|nr:hypothetical protein LNKW23_07080 [Limibaculum sp. NKW23]